MFAIEPHWGNLVNLLWAVVIFAVGSIAAMIIGVPICRLIEWLEEPRGTPPDWEVNFLFGWGIGAMVIIILVFALLADWG